MMNADTDKIRCHDRRRGLTPYRVLLLLFLVCQVLTVQAQGSGPFLVADLDTTAEEGGSCPKLLGTVGGHVYLEASDGIHGYELWRSDGTSEGTVMVTDINPGRPSSYEHLDRPFFSADSLYFRANDGARVSLWRSDGSESGTQRLLDSWTSGGAANASLTFFAASNQQGSELWVSDSTVAGTRMLRDICSGECSSGPSDFVVLGDLVLFTADDGTTGKELWRSDGTGEGTMRVADLCPGECDSMDLTQPVELDGAVYYGATDGVHGFELWRSDGSAAGTLQVLDLGAGALSALPRHLTVVQGKLCYSVSQQLADGYDCGVMESDGTEAGTRWLLHSGPTQHPRSEYSHFVAVGGDLLFREDGPGQEEWLWRYREGTGAERIAGPFRMIYWIESLGDVALLAAFEDLGTTIGLWRSDATSEGTARMHDIDYSTEAVVASGELFFTGISEHEGYELWRSDGSDNGTQLVKNIVGPVASSYPTDLTALPGRLLFVTHDSPSLSSLWSLDPGTMQAQVIASEVGASDLTVLGGTCLFFAGGEPWELEPWVTDGSAGSTQQLIDVQPGPDGSDPSWLTVVGDEAFFFAVTDVSRRLWRSDGTTSGTVLVSDTSFGIEHIPWSIPMAKYPLDVTLAGNTLLFIGYDRDLGPSLWRSDGSSEGTWLITELYNSPPYSTPSDAPADLEAVGNAVYFTEGRANNLRVTDAYAHFIHQVSLPDGMFVRELTSFGGDLLLLASLEDSEGDQLWRVDGTAASLVNDLRQNGQPGSADQLVVVGGQLFISVYHEATGQELWRSDGTTSGTGLVTAIGPGRLGAGLASLRPLGDLLLFAADDRIAGQELWLSNGFGWGTQRVANIMPGRAASSPAEMTMVGDHVFFAAYGGDEGRELWAIPVQTLLGFVLFADGFESGDLSAWSGHSSS